MPWCSHCDRFLNPNSVATDGSCPSCGSTVDPVERPTVERPAAERPTDERPTDEHLDAAATEPDEERVRAPWHFWVMVGGVAIYLGYRLVQGIFWAAHHWL